MAQVVQRRGDRSNLVLDHPLECHLRHLHMHMQRLDTEELPTGVPPASFTHIYVMVGHRLCTFILHYSHMIKLL